MVEAIGGDGLAVLGGEAGQRSTFGI